MIPATELLARKYGVRMACAAVLLAALAFELPWLTHGSAQVQQLDVLEQVTRAAGSQRLAVQPDAGRSPDLDWHLVDRTCFDATGHWR